MQRAPTQEELDLLRKFGASRPSADPELTMQINQLQRVELKVDADGTGGFLHLFLADDAPALRSWSDFPIDGKYEDDDGEPVQLLLHLSAAHVVKLLEYYKMHPYKRVLRWPPAAAQVDTEPPESER